MQNVDLKPPVPTNREAHRLPDDALEVPITPVNQPARKISRETLINRLNYLHFQSAHLTVVLSHRQNGRSLRLPATPQACMDENFTCTWNAPLPSGIDRGDFEMRHLEVPHGHHILQVELLDPQLTPDGLRCRLPEVCHQLTSRRIRRHLCSGIEASVIQNGAVFTGTLEDFNAAAFRLELQATPPQTFQWLKNDEPLNIIFSREGKNLLTIPGQMLRSHGQRDRQTAVIAPALTQQRRFPPKRHRNKRLELRPAPEAVFTHPLTGPLIRLDVTDLSGAGMAVAEAPQEAQLLPGMFLDTLELRLADSFSLGCQAEASESSRLWQ